jgi:hypothetical protein
VGELNPDSDSRDERGKITPETTDGTVVWVCDRSYRSLSTLKFHTNDDCRFIEGFVSETGRDPTEVDKSYAEDWCDGECSACAATDDDG